MPETGLEPARLSAPDPKSGVYSSFTTLAKLFILNILSLNPVLLTRGLTDFVMQCVF